MSPRKKPILGTAAFAVMTAALGVICSPAVFAQDSSPAPIKLNSRHISPAPGLDPAVLQRRDSFSAEPQRLLLQLRRVPSESERQALAEEGVDLLGYVPDNGWFATVSVYLDLGAPQFEIIRWAGPILPEDKISHALRKSGVAAWAIDADGSIKLGLGFFSDVDEQQALDLIARYDGEIDSGDMLSGFQVRFPNTSVISALAREDSVQWIDNATPPPIQRSIIRLQGNATPRNDGARDRTNVNALQGADPSINGSGVRVGVFDGRVDSNHPDFTGRLWVDPNWGDTPPDSHGTHVAGTVGGDGRNSESQGGTPNQWAGVATASMLYSHILGQMVFADHTTAIKDNKINISQNSWGGNFNSTNCTTHNNYSPTAQAFERVVNGDGYEKGIVANVAASNFRQGTSDDQNDQNPICGFAQGPDYINYTSLSDAGSAKNIISVGATQKNATDQMADFSSWGPTRGDGRLKPDIVAPGVNIASTLPGGGYGIQSGTSMATPHISGITALLIQRYKIVFSTENYYPSTIKAVLLHTAKDLDANYVYYTKGPDFASGYGIADAQAAYNGIARDRLFEDTASNGTTDVYSIEVPGGQTVLRATLVWDDATPELNAQLKLVNNLDLELVAPDGTTKSLPWVLDPTNPANAATTGVDNLNNTEQVYVENPSPGKWTINIKGTAVPKGPQKYSLATNLGTQKTSDGGGNPGPDPGPGNASLSNISYNGLVTSNGIKPAFIVLNSAQFVLTAEARTGNGGETPITDPNITLTTLQGAPVASNDNCDRNDMDTLIGRPLGGPNDACIVTNLNNGAYVMQVIGAGGSSGNTLASVTQPAGSTPALLNISYNGFVAAEGIKPAFIIAQSTKLVVTAESFGPNPLPDPRATLRKIDGTEVTSNDDCTDPNIPTLIGRPIGSPTDACIVVDNIVPGAYYVDISDVNGNTGDALVSATQSDN